MALRLPIRNTLDKARFPMFFFRARDTCGATGRPARQTIDSELEKIPLILFASKILRNAEWFSHSRWYKKPRSGQTSARV